MVKFKKEFLNVQYTCLIIALTHFTFCPSGSTHTQPVVWQSTNFVTNLDERFPIKITYRPTHTQVIQYTVLIATPTLKVLKTIPWGH